MGSDLVHVDLRPVVEGEGQAVADLRRLGAARVQVDGRDLARIGGQERGGERGLQMLGCAFLGGGRLGWGRLVPEDRLGFGLVEPVPGRRGRDDLPLAGLPAGRQAHPTGVLGVPCFGEDSRGDAGDRLRSDEEGVFESIGTHGSEAIQPGRAGRAASPARTRPASRCGRLRAPAGQRRAQQAKRVGGLLGDDAVAQRGQLGGPGQARGGGNPARGQAHDPLDELRGEAPAIIGRRRSGPSGSLPAGDGFGVRSPPALAADGVPGGGSSPWGFHSGSTTCDNGGRKPSPARRPGVPLSLALGVGSSWAVADARVRSPLLPR
ncbi:hypothetical protein SAMN05414137_1021 [Streptacidiphilus jiangxiensis]|uniref:Uncharacterized protein n=1 Tax=Streptacidiphilus jiangxiensis TaxID=235985 RepID=A0A1H7GYC6_STRJI|nr:hypothetical protein SAMN05414137_1021 [Streptacidiphilus jiangxiensis]